MQCNASRAPFNASSVSGRENLWQVLWSVALVWLDSLSVHQLLVGVTWVDDPRRDKVVSENILVCLFCCEMNSLSTLHNTQSLEPLTSTKLSGPSASDAEITALDILVGGTGCWLAVDGVVAAGDLLAVVGVDAEAVLAGAVVAVASAGEVLDGPLGSGSGHHVL